MRRTIRDALVGFSILGAMTVFTGAFLWVRGVRMTSKAWGITATFRDATGLAERSPVTYRGILIGSVRKIKVTPQAVLAKLEINKNDLRLPTPVFAKVVKGSMLGGDVQVALISTGDPLSSIMPMPGMDNCPTEKVLCDGATISGKSLISISTLTATLERLLQKAETEDVVSNLSESTKQFDQTQKNLDELITQFKKELSTISPIIENLSHASKHVRNVLGSFDNPQTLDDLKKTANSAQSLTKKLDSVSGNLEKMMEDQELMDAIRKVTIGLGQLFDEVYPAKTSAKAF